METYGVKYEKAVAKLLEDRDTSLAFYGFLAEHWKHIRTTNPIETVFATVPAAEPAKQRDTSAAKPASQCRSN